MTLNVTTINWYQGLIIVMMNNDVLNEQLNSKLFMHLGEQMCIGKVTTNRTKLYDNYISKLNENNELLRTSKLGFLL